MNKPARPRYGTLTDEIGAAIAAAGGIGPPMTEAERFKITVKDGPNLEFVGVLVDSYSQNNTRQRFEEMELFAVMGGGFVAVRNWHSNVAGEETFATAGEVVTLADAMEIWGWTPVAKGFAKKLGWDVVHRIGGES